MNVKETWKITDWIAKVEELERDLQIHRFNTVALRATATHIAHISMHICAAIENLLTAWDPKMQVQFMLGFQVGKGSTWNPNVLCGDTFYDEMMIFHDYIQSLMNTTSLDHAELTAGTKAFAKSARGFVRQINFTPWLRDEVVCQFVREPTTLDWDETTLPALPTEDTTLQHLQTRGGTTQQQRHR